MKKLITILTILIASYVGAQDYGKLSIEPEVGLMKLHGFTYVAPYNVELGARYMFNPKFGVKLQGSYIDHKGYEFYNAGLYGVVNIGRALNFEQFSKNYTVLVGVGGSYTNSSSPILVDRLSNSHISFFVDNLIKVSDRMAIKLGMDFTGDISTKHFIPCPAPSTFTRLISYNTGVVFYLGKKKHADWHVDKGIVDTVYVRTTIIDMTKKINVCNCDFEEYVFFHNDKYEVDKDGLNSISKAATALEEGGYLQITAYASPPASEEYNRILAAKRAETVKSKLISAGVDENRILIEVVGEVDTKDSKNVDLSRKVKLEIVGL